MKRHRFESIAEMFQSSGQSTRRTPATRVEDNVQTPPTTIGLTDITPETSPRRNETNVSTRSDSRSSDSQCSDLIRSSSRPSSSRPSSQPSSDLPLCWVVAGHFMPSDHIHVKAISRIIKSGYTDAWTSYKAVPELIRDQWFKEFQTNFRVEPRCKMEVRNLFDQKASDCMRNSMYSARVKRLKEHKEVYWIDKVFMDKLVKQWESEDFHNQSVTNKSNRLRLTSAGHAVAKSTGGSRSNFDTKLHIGNILGREATTTEVYLVTHTSKTTKQPVDAIAAKNQETLKQKVPDFVPFAFQKGPIPDDIRHEADKVLVDALLDSAAGEKNGRIPGLGNLSLHHSQSSRPQFSTPDAQVLELTQQVSDLTKQNNLLNEKIQEMAARDKARDAEMAARDKARDAEMATIRAFMTRFSDDRVTPGPS